MSEHWPWILGVSVAILAIVIGIFLYICLRRRKYIQEIKQQEQAQPQRDVPDVIPQTTTLPREKGATAPVKNKPERTEPKRARARTLPRPSVASSSPGLARTRVHRTLGSPAKRPMQRLQSVREEASCGDSDENGFQLDVYTQVNKPSKKNTPEAALTDDEVELIENTLYSADSEPVARTKSHTLGARPNKRERSNTVDAYEVVSIVPKGEHKTMSLDRRSKRTRTGAQENLYSLAQNDRNAPRVSNANSEYSLAMNLEQRGNCSTGGGDIYSLAQSGLQKQADDEVTYSLAQGTNAQTKQSAGRFGQNRKDPASRNVMYSLVKHLDDRCKDNTGPDQSGDGHAQPHQAQEGRTPHFAIEEQVENPAMPSSIDDNRERPHERNRGNIYIKQGIKPSDVYARVNKITF